MDKLQIGERERVDSCGVYPYSPLPFQRKGRFQAEVAELVDALGSGLSWGNPVEVQVLSSAPD